MKPLTEAWHFDPLIMVLVASIICLYYLITGFKQISATLCFVSALFLFILAECSPLHALGMRYFSLHMIAHVVELLICGPLLAYSVAPQRGVPQHKRILALSTFFAKHSWMAWLCGVGIMWLWHIPAVFDYAMNQMRSPFSFIPVLQAGSMLLAGLFFSWPILGPLKSAQLTALSGIIYLFTACISCSLLGLLITFAPLDTWQHYGKEDQQAAGLIMWVPCCFVYLSGCLYLLYRWFAETNLPENEINIQLNATITNHE